MKKNFLIKIIAIFMIYFMLFDLSGCNLLNTSSDESDNNVSMIPVDPEDNSDSTIDENIIQVTNTIDADINGDGVNELLEVILKPRLDGDDIDESGINEIKTPYFRVTVNDKCYEVVLCNSKIYDTQMFILNLAEPNNKVVIITLDVGGSGMGHILLYALYFNEGIEFLPLPNLYDESIEELGGSFGLRAKGKLNDNYSVVIEYEETGFQGYISLNKDNLNPLFMDDYDEDGNILNDVAVDISAICSVKENILEENHYVEITQYVYGPTPSDGIGFFISNLRWIDGKLEISNQSCTDFYD